MAETELSERMDALLCRERVHARKMAWEYTKLVGSSRTLAQWFACMAIVSIGALLIGFAESIGPWLLIPGGTAICGAVGWVYFAIATDETTIKAERFLDRMTMTDDELLARWPWLTRLAEAFVAAVTPPDGPHEPIRSPQTRREGRG